jgi:signal transduction histidine kinase
LRNQLDKKTTEILKQNEQLEKKDRIKTRLISIISHDIITPLKFLHLTSKYLFERKASLAENLQTETLEEVVNTSRELELLSTNILNWIKYQNEERRIVKERINLYDLVEQVFVVLKSLANKNNIELINDIPKDIDLVQFVDPLRVIIYNLVVNAINFTKQGNITVRCSIADGEVKVDVRDTGMGMSRTQVNNIKSDLVVVSATNVNKRSGHGLGFLIIKDLLKMVNGKFDIESKINGGTTVSITFPE